jgi:hypothetical protein
MIESEQQDFTELGLVELFEYICTEEYREKYRLLANRLATGSVLEEGEMADALGLPWWFYCAIRAPAIACRSEASVVVYDDDGNAAALIQAEKAALH